jgi:hypothetical protein
MTSIQPPVVTSKSSNPTQHVKYNEFTKNHVGANEKYRREEELVNTETRSTINNTQTDRYGQKDKSSTFSFYTPDGEQYGAGVRGGKTKFYKFSPEPFDERAIISEKDFNTAKSEAGFDEGTRLARNTNGDFATSQQNANILENQVKPESKPKVADPLSLLLDH